MRQRIELENIGIQILNASRAELYLSMPFMGAALDAPAFVMDLSTRTIGTDAFSLRYNPTWLMQVFAENPKQLNRTYIHMMLHCIFRHMFHADLYEDTGLWDLSCDIAVEAVLDEMRYSAIERVVSDFRQEWYEHLTEAEHVLSAERIYHYFITKKRNFSEEETLRQNFQACDHSFWERMRGEEQKDPDKPPADEAPPSLPDSDRDPQEESGADSLIGRMPKDEKEKEWAKKAKRLHDELALHEKEGSDDTGSLVRMLGFTERKHRDYRAFLERFRILREETRVDPDSFDYGFYNYGMEVYGNMPLIEENEYREVRRVEELVIALDTSASCQSVLVQKFLNDTASILFAAESFFKKVEIHIIECDDQVQNDIRITDVEQMRRFAGGFSVAGGYGTDFRPVFVYVEELQKKGILKNLKGLLYFTDGFGIYPEKPTPYDTAFVFYKDEEMSDVQVPDWALKLYMTEGL